MDVLQPELVKVGNRIFRKNRRKVEIAEENLPENQLLSSQTSDFRQTEAKDYIIDDYNDETCDFIPGLEETKNGLYKFRLNVPMSCYGYIIGKKGETKKRLESETNTSINIPKQGQQGDVIITGSIKRNVISAKTRIDLLVDTARQRHQFTHFLSIPLNGEIIQKKFQEFRSAVLASCAECQGVDETIFQSGCHLHLTIGMLTLLSDAEIKSAVETLQRCENSIVRSLIEDQKLVNMELSGLEIMNDDPTSVDVLFATFAPGQHSNLVQKLVDGLVDEFVSCGLMRRERNTVKIHVTLMNSKWRENTEENSQSNGDAAINSNPRNLRKNRLSFDASKILEKFGNYDFGNQTLSTIHLSERSNYDSKSGYYVCRGRINIGSPS